MKSFSHLKSSKNGSFSISLSRLEDDEVEVTTSDSVFVNPNFRALFDCERTVANCTARKNTKRVFIFAIFHKLSMG